MRTKKAATLLVIIALGVMMLVSMPFPASAATVNTTQPWPMFNQNPQHTGAATGSGPTNLSPLWMDTLGGAILGSPVACYGNVYVACCDHNVYCLNATTGVLNWKYTTNWVLRSTPCVIGGDCYIGPDGGIIYCLNAYTGALVWNTTIYSSLILTSMSADPMQIRSSPIVMGNLLYVGAMNDYVYCLNTTKGNVVWSFKTGGVVAASPSVYSGKVYIGSGDSFMYCLNATSGSQLWSYNTGSSKASGTSGISSSADVIPSLNEIVFFANAYAVYYALNMNTGNVIWTYYCMKTRPYTWDQTTQIDSWDSPAYSNVTNNLYCIDDHFAQSLNAATGAAQWPLFGQIPAGVAQGPNAIGNIPGIPIGNAQGPGYNNTEGPNDLGWASVASPAIAGSNVYFGSHLEYLSCLSTSSTVARNSWYEMSGYVDSSPAVAYGNVYVGDTAYQLYCFTNGAVRKLDPYDKTRTVPLLNTTTLTETLSASSIGVGNWMYITGSVNYASGAKIWERADVYALFTAPSGATYRANAMAGWNGAYNIAFQLPNILGTWSVYTWWYGDNYNANCTGTTLKFTVTPTVITTFSPAESQPQAAKIISSILDPNMYTGIAIIGFSFVALAALWHRKKQ